MLGFFAFIALLVGYFVANLYKVADSWPSFLFIGLMLLCLHETFGPVRAARANRNTDRQYWV